MTVKKKKQSITENSPKKNTAHKEKTSNWQEDLEGYLEKRPKNACTFL